MTRQPFGNLLELAGELTRMGAWSVDVATEAVFWSDQVCAIHEVPIGTRPTAREGLSYYAPEHRLAISDALEECLHTGVPFDLDLKLVTAKRRELWVRAIGQAARDEQGHIVRVHGAFQDISRLKKAESDARRLAERLYNTLESIADCFYILDRDWRFTYLNSEAIRCLQKARDQLIGNSIWGVFEEAAGTVFDYEYHRALRDNISVSFDAYYPPFARWFQVRAYPSVEGLAVYFQDITEQRAAVEALRQSEARFRVVAKSTTDTIWDWNLTANTVWWNDGLTAAFGYKPEDVEPDLAWWSERIHAEDRERVMSSVQAAISNKVESWREEYRFIRKNGSIAHVMDRGFIIFDDEGNAVRMAGGMTDMTERKQLEERSRHSQHMEALGQLTGGVAHDFNNLLTVILGNAEVLTERLAQDEGGRALAKMMGTAAERGAELTKRLLAFARRQSLDTKVIPVHKLVSAMNNLLRCTLGEQIDIRLNSEGTNHHALADAAQLESAVLNLCINARDAMENGGRISIEVANTTVDRDEGPDLTPGEYVTISVSDNGTGMPEYVVARAFEPFFTTKGVGKGSGLGLSMVYGFAKQSGGHVTIASSLGQGTTVRLYLPRAAQVEDDQATTLSALPHTGGGEKILMVEDDDMVRAHVTEQLRALGYDVEAARNGPEALRVLRQNQEFDLLFTDIVMPGGMNGRELAKEARKIEPSLPILLTSGYSNETENPESGTLLLQKPYSRNALAEKLRLALARTDEACSFNSTPER